MTSSVRKREEERIALDEVSESSNTRVLTGHMGVQAIHDSSTAARRSSDDALAETRTDTPSRPTSSPRHTGSGRATTVEETSTTRRSDRRTRTSTLRICSSVSPRSNSRSRTPPTRGLRIVSSMSPARSLPHDSRQSWGEDVRTPTVHVQDAPYPARR